MGVSIGWVDFGTDQQFASIHAFNRHAQRGFTITIVIEFRRVKEIAAMFHRVPNHFIHVGLAARSPIVAAAKGPTSDSEHWELKIMCSAKFHKFAKFAFSYLG